MSGKRRTVEGKDGRGQSSGHEGPGSGMTLRDGPEEGRSRQPLSECPNVTSSDQGGTPVPVSGVQGTQDRPCFESLVSTAPNLSVE